MLTAVGRAAARGVQTARLPSTTSSTAQLLSRQASSPSATALRSFSVTAWARQSTSSQEKPPRKPRAKKTSTTEPASEGKVATKAESKPKPEKVKELSPEQQEKRDARQLKLEIRQLKKWALLEKTPKLPANAWNLYIAENIAAGGDGNPLGKTKELAEKFKTLPASELQDLETRAHANRETNIENLQKWVESHEPAQILLANQSRTRLAELQDKTYRAIKDDRLPVAPANSYGLFLKANYDKTISEHGGEFGKASKLLSQQFKGLTAAEKREYEEKYEDLRAAYKGRMNALLEQIERIRTESVAK